MINEIPIYMMFHPKSIYYHQNENPVLLYRQGRRNSIISGEAPQVKEHTRAGNFKTLL